MKKWVAIVFSLYLLMASSPFFAVAKQDVSARETAKEVTEQVAKQFTREGAKTGTTLVQTGVKFSKHGLERLAERGITKKMAEVAINKGLKFYDPKNKSINYVLKNYFGSGKDLLIGTNSLTGEVCTVLRGSNLINSRMLPIK